MEILEQRILVHVMVKLYEILMTNEECVCSIDIGNYYRVLLDGRDLNYDKFLVEVKIFTQQMKHAQAITQNALM